LKRQQELIKRQQEYLQREQLKLNAAFRPEEHCSAQPVVITAILAIADHQIAAITAIKI
jgi:hypothetical protein